MSIVSVISLFLSTYENKIDKKGRISVPSPYRAIVQQQSFQGIIIHLSFINPCIEACGIERLEKIHQSIDLLDPFSEERDIFATTLLGGSIHLPFDSEGRVILPSTFLEKIHIVESAIFVGKGHSFEIWEKEAFYSYAEIARKKAKEARKQLQVAHQNPPKIGGCNGNA